MQVTVYSLPGSVCHACRFTKRLLTEKKINYTEVRVDNDPEGLAFLKKEVLDNPNGRLQMPVVRVDFGEGATLTWQGLQPSQIERLASEIMAA